MKVSCEVELLFRPTGDEVFCAIVRGHFIEIVLHGDGLKARHKVFLIRLEQCFEWTEAIPEQASFVRGESISEFRSPVERDGMCSQEAALEVFGDVLKRGIFSQSNRKCCFAEEYG